MESITYVQGTFYNMNTNEKQINDKTFNSCQYNSVIGIKILIWKNVKSIYIKRLGRNALIFLIVLVINLPCMELG